MIKNGTKMWIWSLGFIGLWTDTIINYREIIAPFAPIPLLAIMVLYIKILVRHVGFVKQCCFNHCIYIPESVLINVSNVLLLAIFRG